jgi:hypothetical protein
VVLVPKHLLSDRFFPTLTIGNLETMNFVLTDEFARNFNLSRHEIEEVNKAVADALHEYRTLETKNLKQTDARPQRSRPELANDEEAFHFRLTPFPKEALAIRAKLEEAVEATLGEERSKFFWKGDCLSGEMPTFTDPPFTLPDAKITITHTFVRATNNAEQVRRLITEYLVMPGASGSSGAGRPMYEPLDQYAPESMKPVLARWRNEAKVRQNSGNTEAAPGSAENAGVKRDKRSALPPPAISAAAPEDGTWNERDAFTEMSKNGIRGLKIPGLTVDEDLSAEAIALFDLSGEQVKAVNTLYHEMRIRSENIERDHFERAVPGQNSFVLRAFPEKTAALEKEWFERLKKLVGASRGDLLDHAIRTPIGDKDFMRQNPRGDAMRRLWMRGVTWMDRGSREMRINVTKGVDERGRPAITIEYEAEGPGAARGSNTFREGDVPKRWQHLLTPDVLRAEFPVAF